MSDDECGRGRAGVFRIGSLTTIVLVFSLLSVVVLAILLGALFVAIGVVVVAVPAALIAGLSKARRDRARAASSGTDRPQLLHRDHHRRELGRSDVVPRHQFGHLVDDKLLLYFSRAGCEVKAPAHGRSIAPCRAGRHSSLTWRIRTGARCCRSASGFATDGRAAIVRSYA